jgi:polyhydroxyalkanoate synthase
MSEYAFDPVQLVNEINQLNQKIAAGVDTLSHLKPIEMSQTPREAVYKEHLITLYRYTPLREVRNPTPLLLFGSLFNRPDLFDLQPDRSFVLGLLEQGVDLYLIDWGNPERADRFLDCNDYINGFLRRCIRFITTREHLSQINLMGFSLGGVFALAFAALHPERVRNLIVANTPVNFHETEVRLAHLLKHIQIENLVESYGNIPGEIISSLLITINPFRSVAKKLFEFIDRLDEREETLFFLRMNKWVYDCPDLAGETFRNLAEELFQRNLLSNQAWFLGEKQVDLKAIDMPLLNIHAQRDPIFPPSSSDSLKALTSSGDYTLSSPNSGHTGLFVAKKEAQTLPCEIAQWLSKREIKADSLV